MTDAVSKRKARKLSAKGFLVATSKEWSLTLAALRAPWSKWALMRRSSILKLSGALVPLRRLRFTCRKKIVEGVREVGGRKFVGCDGFLDAFFKRDFPPSSCFQTVKALVVTSHKDCLLYTSPSPRDRG